MILAYRPEGDCLPLVSPSGFSGAFTWTWTPSTKFVARIYDDFRVLDQAVDHFELRAEVPADTNFLYVNAVFVRDRDNLRTCGPKEKCIRGHDDSMPSRRWSVVLRSFRLAPAPLPAPSG